MLSIPQHVATITAVGIAKNASAPMPRRHVSDGYIAVPVAAPPVQFDHVTKSEIRDQIENMFWHDDCWSRPAPALCVLHERPQRRPVQVVKMRVRNQDDINRRKVLNSYPGLTQSL